MADFKHGGNHFGGGRRDGFDRRDGGRPNFSNKNWDGGDRNRGPVSMHQAVCNQCGNPCEVPFRPISGKPVYCNNCFQSKKEGGNDRGGFGQKRFDNQKPFIRSEVHQSGQNSGELKNQLVMLNAKMDQLIAAVKAMAPAKPSEEIKLVGPAKLIQPTKTKPDEPAKSDAAGKTKKIIKRPAKKSKK